MLGLLFAFKQIKKSWKSKMEANPVLNKNDLLEQFREKQEIELEKVLSSLATLEAFGLIQPEKFSALSSRKNFVLADFKPQNNVRNEAAPNFETVRDFVSKMVRGGEIKSLVSQMKITKSEFAKFYGCTEPNISLTIRNNCVMKEATRRKILAAIDSWNKSGGQVKPVAANDSLQNKCESIRTFVNSIVRGREVHELVLLMGVSKATFAKAYGCSYSSIISMIGDNCVMKEATRKKLLDAALVLIAEESVR